MDGQWLTPVEQKALLLLARDALERGVRGLPIPEPDWDRLPPRLREPGATFVTLTKHGQLRGCIGSLEPRLPLALDVQKNAVAAALQDPRFFPVTPDELPEIRVEVSYLTPPKPLPYTSPEDLLRKLKPGVHGVVLVDPDTGRRATFLPQVWEQLPDPEVFLSHLSMKMGAPPDLWRRKPLDVYVYTVQKFAEGEV
ncbi:MAG: AmmeMemoRadiSam system protein A [Chloroflexi bacterium]|nr:AmmeMemoRadiSam system protein A [Chloroflexota bacterium]